MTRPLQIIVNLLILALAIYLITLGVLGFRLLWNRRFGEKRPVSKPIIQKPPRQRPNGKPPTLRFKKRDKRDSTKKTPGGQEDTKTQKGKVLPFMPYRPNSWRKPPAKIEPPSSQRKKPKTPEGITDVGPPKKRYRKKVDNDKAKMGDPNRTMCVKQLKTLQTAVLKYAMMHDGMAPDSEKLLEALGEASGHPVDGKYLECPLGHRYLYLGGGRDVIREEGDIQLFRCPKHSVSITVQGKFPKKEK